MSDIAEHLTDSSTCVVAFSTEKPDSEAIIPRLEFGRTLARLELAYVLVCDRGHWYHQGVTGIGSMDASVDYFVGLKGRYSRLVMMGASYGAHGALLYGQKVPATEVIAISPIADVGAWQSYWSAKKGKNWRNGSPVHRHDLAPLFVNGPLPKVKAFVGTGNKTIFDRPSCDRLKIDDVTVFEGMDHTEVARHMRDSGWFERLLCT